MIRPPRPRPESRRAAARRRVTTEPGDIYAAASADGKWVKIGFSQDVPARLRTLNLEYQGDAEFALIATTRSTYATEQQLHRAMQPLHQVRIKAGREFYPACPAVSEIVKELIETQDSLELDTDWYFRVVHFCRASAGEDCNRLPALEAHREIVEANAAAEARNIARVEARLREIAARRAARAAERMQA